VLKKYLFILKQSRGIMLNYMKVVETIDILHMFKIYMILVRIIT